MSVRPQQQERLNVAIAAVTCGRLTGGALVSASRGRCRARADEYGVTVTEPRAGTPASADADDAGNRELVLELWGAEMLTLSSPLKGSARRADPLGRARVAARTVRDHELDSLQIEYPDGARLHADQIQVVLYGPRQGVLRRRARLLRVALGELL
jgi:hypothetical protein